MGMKPLVLRMLTLLLGVLGLAVHPAAAQMDTSSPFAQYTTLTASYRITIRIGPKVTMSMARMTTTDQEKAVNHHLEVYVFDKRTGVEVKQVVPAVVVTNQRSRASRTLTNLTACQVSRHRETEPHFGDNLYLPDGTFTVLVTVGRQSATFTDIVVKDV